MEKLMIDDIRTDGGTQPRSYVDIDAAYEYADDMRAGSKFPPVTVFYDGQQYWLVDGFHRLEAVASTGADTIECEVIQGTLEDAQWYSFGVNKTNGIRRTNEDKHRAVVAALKHPKGVGLSDRAIAEHVGVDKETVGAWREKLELTGEIRQSIARTGRDGRTINTANIGRSKREKPATQPTADAGESPRVAHEMAPSFEDRLADDWASRVHRACVEIVDCEVTAKDIASAIRRGAHRQPRTQKLKEAYEFLTEVVQQLESF